MLFQLQPHLKPEPTLDAGASMRLLRVYGPAISLDAARLADG